jgi:hypothetical protein
VERIHNAQVHSAIGVSPAQLLFGNSVQLDRNLLTPIVEIPRKEIRQTSQMKYLDELIHTQNVLISIAAEHQRELDEANRAKRNPRGEITLFPVNSFVLLRNNRDKQSKFETNWIGPYRVINVTETGAYVIQDVLTFKNVDAVVNQLKAFNYDINDYDAPARVATHSKGEYFIESIENHRGDRADKTHMHFLVKWAGFPPEYNSWEPWSSLKDTAQLEKYLQENKMKSLLHKQKAHTNKRKRYDLITR